MRSRSLLLLLCSCGSFYPWVWSGRGSEAVVIADSFVADGKVYTIVRRGLTSAVFEIDPWDLKWRELARDVAEFDVERGRLYLVTKKGGWFFLNDRALKGPPLDSPGFRFTRRTLVVLDGREVRFYPKTGGDPSLVEAPAACTVPLVDYDRDRLWALRGASTWLTLAFGETQWREAELAVEGEGPLAAAGMLCFGKSRVAYLTATALYAGTPDGASLRLRRVHDLDPPFDGSWISFESRDTDILHLHLSYAPAPSRRAVKSRWMVWDLAGGGGWNLSHLRWGSGARLWDAERRRCFMQETARLKVIEENGAVRERTLPDP